MEPPPIDVDYEIVTEPDRRPFWRRYRLVWDWRLSLVLAITSAIAVARMLLGG